MGKVFHRKGKGDLAEGGKEEEQAIKNKKRGNWRDYDRPQILIFLLQRQQAHCSSAFQNLPYVARLGTLKAAGGSQLHSRRLPLRVL